MADFISFARAHGVLINRLEDSGRIRRCGTVEHPKSTNGAYLWDGQRGFVFAWDGDAEPHWFNDPHAKPWTDEEKRAFATRQEAERRKKVERYRAAAAYAQDLIQSAKLDEHGYFQYKGLPDARGLVLPDGKLFVPMRSLTGALQGGQTIHWDHEERKYEKMMLSGMRAKGAVLRLGSNRAMETILCEGYVTGLSIEMAVRQLRLSASVLVCFSDSNMVFVAPSVTGRKYVFADNDASGAGEKAAKQIGLPYCMSDRIGEDANDLHKRAGLLTVCQLLIAVRRLDEAA
jgi:putative DNA primase/helicase